MCVSLLKKRKYLILKKVLFESKGRNQRQHVSSWVKTFFSPFFLNKGWIRPLRVNYQRILNVGPEDTNKTSVYFDGTRTLKGGHPRRETKSEYVDFQIVMKCGPLHKWARPKTQRRRIKWACENYLGQQNERT